MSTQRCLYMIAIFALLVFSSIADGKLLFRDDFERDTIGEEPKNFEIYDIPGNSPDFRSEIVKDPEGESGKVVHTYSTSYYIPKAPDIENWTDWIWEWDWMWSEAGFPGTAFRITDGNFYHISPRDDNMHVGFWYYDGNWNQRGDLAEYDFGLMTWNRFQVIAKGDTFTLRIKRRIDDTPFEEIKPLIEVTDNTLDKGPLSVMGTNTDAWMDNFIVAESEEDFITAVEADDKLSITWGNIKKKSK